MSFESPEAVVAELEQFIANDGDLYRSQTTLILKNLATKKARGEYKHDLAVKAFGYLVESGAKKYAKEFGGTWHKMFDVPTRRRVAESFTKDFEGEYKLGNYDSLLPKKYQKKEAAAPRHHSSVKTSATKGKWRVPEGLAVRWAPVNNAWFLLWPTSAPLNKQQVLKVAGTEEMHDFLRDRYGESYGLATRAAQGRGHSTIKRPRSPARRASMISARDIREFNGFLRNASDRQLQGIYQKELRAGRYEYAELALAEADRRDVSLLDLEGGREDDVHREEGEFAARGGYFSRAGRGHSTIQKSPSQIKREIAEVLSKRAR